MTGARLTAHPRREISSSTRAVTRTSRRAAARRGELLGVSPGKPVTRQVSIPFFATWISMLVVLLLTHALIPVAQTPAAHTSWLLWPIRNATLLAAIVGALVVIAAYVGI